MLFEAMSEPCATLLRTVESDSEGGFTEEWEQGGTFNAAIVERAAKRSDIADKITEETSWKVTSDRPLLFHEIFKRLSDGKTFRATSNGMDGAAPGVASFGFFQCEAESWEVPNE